MPDNNRAIIGSASNSNNQQREVPSQYTTLNSQDDNTATIVTEHVLNNNHHHHHHQHQHHHHLNSNNEFYPVGNPNTTTTGIVGGGTNSFPSNSSSNNYSSLNTQQSYIQHHQQQQQQQQQSLNNSNNNNDQNNNSDSNNVADVIDSASDNQNTYHNTNQTIQNSRRDFFEEIRSGGGHWSQLLRQVQLTPKPSPSSHRFKKISSSGQPEGEDDEDENEVEEEEGNNRNSLEEINNSSSSAVINSDNSNNGQIPLQVLGGSENGQFVYVSVTNSDINDWIAVGYLQTGDIILDIQGQQVAGYTGADVLSLLYYCLRDNTVLTVAPRGSLGPELRSYLNTRFQKGSVDHALQGVVRDNLYLRTVPVTTRPPRLGEIHGVDYTFLSPEEFMELERNGSLLESGVYAGNHYGTPKPWAASGLRNANLQLDSNDGAQSFEKSNKSSLLPGMHPSSEGKRRRNRSNVEALGAGDDEPPSPDSTKKNSEPNASFASRAPPPDELGPLPANWEMSYTEKGEVYFIDHNTGTSHWLDPRLSRIQKLSLEDCADNELPFGWEKIEDPHYGTYYIDHVNRRTQFENPVLQAKQQTRPDNTSGNNTNSFDGERPSNSHKPTKIPPVAPPKPINPNKISVQRVRTPVEFPIVNSNSGSAEFNSTSHNLMPSSSSNSALSGLKLKPGHVREKIRFFTRDPNQLVGERIETVLLKSSRGLGFTIVGGDDDDGLDEFLQIKSVVTDGPAWRDGKLRTGDVLVRVNGRCVLGYTHQEMVSIFQSIAAGEEVHLEVCRGYPLPFDPADPNTEIVTTVAVAPMDSSEKMRRHDWSGRAASPDSLPHSAHSLPELTNDRIVYGKSSTGRPASVDLLLDSSPSHLRFDKESTKRYSIDPGIFLTVDIVKGTGGFGFTIADSVAGQKVKKVLDPTRCGGLEEGDRLIAIDGIDLRGLSHTQVVQVLKDFPLEREASLIVQRTNMRSSYSFQANSGVSNNYVDSKQFPNRSGLFPRSKTPTADLGRTRPRLRDTLPERPKTPLLDSVGQVNGHMYNDDIPNSIQQMYPYMSEKQQINPTELGPTNEPGFPANDLSQIPTIREWVEMTIDLQRRQEGFGFRIVGGTEEGSQVSVGHIVPRGAAALDGRLQTNDQLISIDGVSVIGSSHHSVVQLMARSAAAGRVRLNIRRAIFGNIQTEPDGLGGHSLHLGPSNEHLIVTLRRQPPEGFGFVIISSASKAGATIGRIVDGSPADRCGQLQVGDKILAVNHIDISQLHHSQVVQLIKDSGLTLSLSVLPITPTSNLIITHPIQVSPGLRSHEVDHHNLKDGQGYDLRTAFVSGDEQPMHFPNQNAHASYPENMDQIFSVQLSRGNRGFGFSIRGGKEFQNMPLFVLKIADDGPASQDSRMQVGDQILQINGYNTQGMTHAQAINIIKNGGANVHLLLRRGPFPFPIFNQTPNFQQGGYFASVNGHEEEQSLSSNNDSHLIGQNSPMYRDPPHV